MPLVEAAARKMGTEGIDWDVYDLRTLYPYDWEAIRSSVERTGRVIFVGEDREVCNLTEHLLRRVCDELFYCLAVRPRILGGRHTPGIGLAPILEDATQPQGYHIEREMRELVNEPA